MQQVSVLEYYLSKIYDSPASISVVLGKWKSGKTDFALRLAYDELYNRGLVKEVASNIKTNQIRYIDNFTDLSYWLFKDQHRKAFIYDEAIKSTPSRKAMSAINTKWLEYVPELSKARCHFIVITQEEDYTEKLFLHPTFVRAKWVKRDLTTVDLIVSGQKEIIRFKGIPKTTVPFDPYSIAIWKMESDYKEILAEDDDIRIVFDYADLTSDEIVDSKKYPFIHDRKDVTIHLKRGIRKIRDLLWKDMLKRSGGIASEEESTTT